MEYIEQTDSGGSQHALYLNNLAALLMSEIQAGSIPIVRLIEARDYAEQALAIRETLDESGQIWITLGVLAEIATLENRLDIAQIYRRRERETFVAFQGNRHQIDQEFKPLIVAIVEATKGHSEAREIVEEVLPELEENGWHITAAIKRIWAGERDWYALVENLDGQDALLILRVLETLAKLTETQGQMPEKIIQSLPSPVYLTKSLPSTIREALEHGDISAFQQAFQELLPEDQQGVAQALHMLKEIADALRTPQVLQGQKETMPSVVELALASLPPNYHVMEYDDIITIDQTFEPFSQEGQ